MTLFQQTGSKVDLYRHKMKPILVLIFTPVMLDKIFDVI